MIKNTIKIFIITLISISITSCYSEQDIIDRAKRESAAGDRINKAQKIQIIYLKICNNLISTRYENIHIIAIALFVWLLAIYFNY